MGGWQVAGYAEMAELGRGGTGRVVAAVDVATGERVAIKYLADGLAGEPRFRDAFRAEAAILAGFWLPNVAGIRRYVEWAGGAAIVMQLVEGVSLRAILAAAGPTDPLAALYALRGSLLGLAGAHAHGIVHRDYKPENVIVDPAGSSMLVDFGIALRAGTRNSPAGTPGYMAPEQWAGGPASPATDIYAAAVTYAECLTGVSPPAWPPRMAAMSQPAATAPAGASPPAGGTEPAGSPRTADPARPADGRLAALITRATSRDPARRPASATEFLTELELAADQQYGPGWPAAGRAALGRAAAVVASAAAGAAIGAAAAAGQALPPTTAPTARATTRLGRSTGRKAARTAAKAGGKSGLSHGAIAGIGAAAALVVGAAVTIAVLTHHQSPATGPDLAEFRGSWYVHDGTLCVGDGLQLAGDHVQLAADQVPACSGSSDAGWMRGWFGCSVIRPGTVRVCDEWDELSFSQGPGDTLNATVTKIIWTTLNNAVIKDFNPGPGNFEPGDTFRLSYVATGLLKTTYLRTHLAKLDLKYGNPYWCGPGISTSNQQKCGA